jgi:deoxyribose-phosphate aldolase
MSEVSETKPEQARYEDLAQLIELALLAPELSESDVAEGCEQAKQYGVAAVLVRPCDIDLAARWVSGSPVVLGAAVDMPYGYSTTTVKVFAVRDALRRGAKEIDTIMNTGKLISRQFQYLETELLQMADACHAAGATLKVALESEHLNEELNVVACRIARRAGVDFLAAHTIEDIALLKNHSRDRLKLKAAGPVESLEAALEFRTAGCARVQSLNPKPVLDAWKARLAEAEALASQAKREAMLS